MIHPKGARRRIATKQELLAAFDRYWLTHRRDSPEEMAAWARLAERERKLAERWERRRRIMLGEVDPPRPTIFHDLSTCTHWWLTDERKLSVARRLAGRLGAPIHPRKWPAVAPTIAREARATGSAASAYVRQRHVAAVWEGAATLVRDMMAGDHDLRAGASNDSFWRSALESRVGSILAADVMGGAGWRSGGDTERERAASLARVAEELVPWRPPAADAAVEVVLRVAREAQERDRNAEAALAEAEAANLPPRLAEALVAIRAGADTPRRLANALTIQPGAARQLFHRLRVAGAL